MKVTLSVLRDKDGNLLAIADEYTMEARESYLYGKKEFWHCMEFIEVDVKTPDDNQHRILKEDL